MTLHRRLTAYALPGGIPFPCSARWDPKDPHALVLAFGQPAGAPASAVVEWTLAVDAFRPGQPQVPGADVHVTRPWLWRAPGGVTARWILLHLRAADPADKDANIALEEHGLDVLIHAIDHTPRPELDMDAAIRELLDGYQH